MRSVGEPPTASPFGHPRTAGVNWDPRVCHDVQGDITTERQLVLVHLFAVVVAEWSGRLHLCSSSHRARSAESPSFLLRTAFSGIPLASDRYGADLL